MNKEDQDLLEMCKATKTLQEVYWDTVMSFWHKLMNEFPDKDPFELISTAIKMGSGMMKVTLDAASALKNKKDENDEEDEDYGY